MAALVSSVDALLHDPKYADLEIRCDGRSFNVHRAIVCPRSKVLDRECSGGFLESDTRIVNHITFDADTLEWMLEFIYRGSYSIKLAKDEEESKGTRWCPYEPTRRKEEEGHPEPSIYHSITCMSSFQSKSFEELRLEDYMQDNSPSIGILQQHIQVYAIADYYELPDLKLLALRHFQASKSFLLPIVNDELIQVIEAIYSNTPSSDEDLRYEILAFCIDEKKTLLKDGFFVQAIVDSPELQQFTAEFMLGLTHRQQEDLENEQKSHHEVATTLQSDNQRLTNHLDALQKQLPSIKANADSVAAQLKQTQENLALVTKARDQLSRRLHVSKANFTVAQSNQHNKIVAQIIEFEAIKVCRHCGSKFDFYLEREGGGYKARCESCTTRHHSKIVIT